MLINVFSIAYPFSIRETFSLQNVMIFFKGVFLLTNKKIDHFVIFATKVCIYHMVQCITKVDRTT